MGCRLFRHTWLFYFSWMVVYFYLWLFNACWIADKIVNKIWWVLFNLWTLKVGWFLKIFQLTLNIFRCIVSALFSDYDPWNLRTWLKLKLSINSIKVSVDLSYGCWKRPNWYFSHFFVPLCYLISRRIFNILLWYFHHIIASSLLNSSKIMMGLEW